MDYGLIELTLFFCSACRAFDIWRRAPYILHDIDVEKSCFFRIKRNKNIKLYIKLFDELFNIITTLIIYIVCNKKISVFL